MQTKKMSITIILSLLILISANIFSQLSMAVFYVWGVSESICYIGCSILYVAYTVLLLIILCRKYLEEEDMSEYNVPSFKIDTKWLVISAIPLLVSIALFINIVIRCHNFNRYFSYFAESVCWLGVSAGIVEELVFRGIIMGIIEQRFNKKVAIILSAVIFGMYKNFYRVGFGISLIYIVLEIIVGIILGLIASEKKIYLE